MVNGTYSRRQPLLVGDNDTANSLHADKASPGSGGLQILEDKALDLGIVVHVVLVNTKLLGLLDEDLLVGHDDSDGARVLRVGIDHHVCDSLSTAVDRLKLLESNVLATLHLDEVLDTINDLQVTVGIELANITGLEPAVGSEGLGGLLGVVEVLLHDGETLEKNLTLRNLGVGRVAELGDGHELNVDGGRDRADSVGSVLERRAQGAVGTGLSQTVASKHRRENQGDEMLGAGGDTAGTVHGESKAATGKLTDLTENDAVEDASEGQLVSGHERLVAVGAPEEVLKESAAALQFSHDTLADSLPNLGDTDHNRGAELAHITSAVFDGAVGERARVTVSEGSTNVKDQVLQSHLEDVGKREVGENDFLVADTLVDASKKTSYTGNKRLMGNASTLGKACGARSVHDAEQVSSLGRVGLDHVLLAELGQLVVRKDVDVGVLRLERFNLATSSEDTLRVDNDGLHLGLLDGVGGRLKQVRVSVHGAGTGLEEGVLDTARAESIVSSDDGDGLGSAAMGHGEPVQATETYC